MVAHPRRHPQVTQTCADPHLRHLCNLRTPSRPLLRPHRAQRFLGLGPALRGGFLEILPGFFRIFLHADSVAV